MNFGILNGEATYLYRYARKSYPFPDYAQAALTLSIIIAVFIAATMIAIGTSLPELVTTIISIRKKQASLSVGNIIGANILDLTLIMPLCALQQGARSPSSARACCSISRPASSSARP